MPAETRSGFFALYALLLGALSLAAGPAMAGSPTFSDLLEKAKEQASAGHRWTPPGDNMTETIMQMMDLVPTATPGQLAELSALLEKDKSTAANSINPTPLNEAGPTVGVANPPADQPPASSEAKRTEGLAKPPADLSPAENTSKPGLNQGLADPGAKPSVNLGAIAPETSPPLDQSSRGSSPQGVHNSTKIPRVPPDTTTASLPSPMAPPPSLGVAPALGVAIAPPAAPSATLPTTYERPDVGGSAKVPPRPGPRAAALFTRGLDAENHGDFSAARRFYLSAAEQGEAAAARNLGRLYDPAYLNHTALGGVDPDPALARQWYERAVKLGDPQAGPLLEAISQR